MRILVFDFETTGLIDFKLAADHPDQPDIVEIAAVTMTGPDTVTEELENLILPDDWSIPPEITGAVHGITDEMCEVAGVPLGVALGNLARMIDCADVVVGYNIEFDLKLFRGGCRRLGMDDRYLAVKRKKFDVMQPCKPLCKCPPTDKMIEKNMGHLFKPPKLEEAAKILLGQDIIDAHRAMVDVRATAALYWLLQGDKPATAPATEVPAPELGQATSPPRAGVAPHDGTRHHRGGNEHR